MPDIPQGVKWFAHVAYFLLPLFLAVVAGICMLIATLRKTLTSGMAASFAGLGGVVVFGLIFVAGRTHGHGGVERRMEQTTHDQEFRRLAEENKTLRAKLKAFEGTGREGKPTGALEKVPPPIPPAAEGEPLKPVPAPAPTPEADSEPK